MAQPTSSQVHAINVPLTNISTAYIQNQSNFIAGKVFPKVSVKKKSDAFYTYPKNSWLRDEARPRAGGTESVGSGYDLGTDNYTAKVWAIHKDIDEQARDNADAGINLDRDATEFVTQRILLSREIQWMTDYFTTSVWSSPDIVPSALWSAYATSDPVGDIETGKTRILSVTSYMPNTLVLGYQTFVQLKNHPDIIDRINRFAYSGSVINATEQMLAVLFGVQNVYVSMGIKATNVEGETAATSFIAGKHALLAYIAPRPSLMTPSAGYTFSWDGVANGMPGAEIGIKKFYIPDIASDRVEGQIAYANKVIGSDLGVFYNGAVA